MHLDKSNVGWNTGPEFDCQTGSYRLESTQDSLLLGTTISPSLYDPIDRYARLVLKDSSHKCFAVPSTRGNATAGAIIAPGGEHVGQVQIVTEFSKPFELEGLFGAADAGAFAGRVDVDDQPMGMVDEDGDVFWDAVEDPGFLPDKMDDVKDGVPMESDDLKHIIPKKRSRSPSDAPNPVHIDSLTTESEAASRHTRQPKRQRRSKDIPSYDSPPDEHVRHRMGKYNPLSRTILKREAKRARKALRAIKDGEDRGGFMDVDDDGLQFTFIA